MERFQGIAFFSILKELHFNDNGTAIPRGKPGYDRAHKVRPVIRSVVEKCNTLYVPHRENAVDEAMVNLRAVHH